MEDLYDTEKRLESVLKKIENSGIIKSNKKKLVEFTNHCLADSVGKNKASRYLYDLYNISIWLNKDFEKANKQDIERILVKLQEATNIYEKPYSEWTKKGYKVIIKKFFKWLRKTETFPDEVKWIKSALKENQKKLPEDMLTEEEILSLINTSQNIRDKALIALLFDSGCRIGELLNMRIRDIEYFENGMKIYLSGKTGMRRIPIIFSVPYLNNWLNEHPTKKLNDYIWVKTDGKRLSYGRVRFMIKGYAKRIGVTKRVNPHNFRHSRCSFYVDKLKDRIMMEYFGWKKADTIAIYAHVNGKQVEDSILEANGIIPEHKKEKTILNPKICQRCNKTHEATALYCTCGFPLNKELVEEIKQKEMERQKADEIMNKLVSDPEVLELIKKKLSQK